MNTNLHHKYFKLFSNCFLVKGYRRSLILDVSRQKQFFVPNALESLIKESQSNSVGYIYANHYEYKQYIDEYFDYLIQNELGHFLEEDELEMFPPMCLTYSEPRHITNAILEFNEFDCERFRIIISKINGLLCEAVVIRFLNEVPKQEIVQFLTILEGTSICNISLQLSYVTDYTFDFLKAILQNYPRVDCVDLYGIPKNKEIMQVGKIRFFEKKIGDISCGSVSPSFFSTNLRFFVEAKSKNTCLNKKLCVDSAGEIKNCLHMEKSYGNIYSSNLLSLIVDPLFTSFWNTTKDSVAVCMHCEYRFMCNDCRAFIKDTGNIYSQPSKCTYNPYIAKWAGEDGYVPVEECGFYSRENGFVVDTEKVEALNQRIMN